MTKLDETLGRALQDTAERYRPGEIVAARERFSRRGRRRRVVRAGAAVTLVTACVAGVALLARPEVISGRAIHPASGSVITVGDAPVSVAIFDGAAWVVNRGDGTVTRVDGGTGEGEGIDLGDEAEPASITEGENALWFTDEFLPGFAPIEPKERTVPTSFPIEDAGEEGAIEGELALGDIAVGGGRVWLALRQEQAGIETVSLADLQNNPGSAAGILLGPGELPELTFGQDVLWFSHEHSVATFDPDRDGASRTNVASVSGAGDLVFGAGSVWTVVDGGAVVRLVPKVRRTTVDEGGATVREEVIGLEVSAKVPANAEAEARIAFGEGSVWVVSGSNGDGELVQIDPDKDEVVGRFALSGGPFAVAAGDGWLWVTDEGGDRVLRIDPKSPGGHPATP